MSYARFWLRSFMDERPIDELKKDSYFEIWDWGELPEGAVYNRHLAPRDWSLPQSAMIETMRLFSDPIVGRQVVGKRLAHLELMTVKGAEVILTDRPREEEEPVTKENWLRRLFRRLRRGS